ncbi:VIN3-like protein [Drosera capensis]
MLEQQLIQSNRASRNQGARKTSFSSPSSSFASRKQGRKAENPSRFVPTLVQQLDIVLPSWVCKNAACRAVLSLDDSFCRRCSCCICHQFDDNKDPSLWLLCESDSPESDSCGLSCHIECALRKEKVGVVNLGQFMELDGSYCCASCGKISGILRSWKKQLVTAKEARRVDVLCHRILLSYRLLDGTSRFKELHEVVSDAKKKLEEELGPLHGDSINMARGIVSRLSVAGYVQKLCSCAIEKADEWLASASTGSPNGRVDSLPAACRFQFEEITSSSLSIVLIELPIPRTDLIKGYKLWLCKSLQETFSKEPVSTFPREKRRISISKLQPCTEYTFRIISYTEAGDLGHSEAKCFTKSVEIGHKKADTLPAKKEPQSVEGSSSTVKGLGEDGSSTGFMVRDLGKILQLAWSQEQGFREGSCSVVVEKCCDGGKPNIEHQSPPLSRDLDLNVASVPDLNEDLVPPFDFSRDEDDGCTLERAAVPIDDSASHDCEKNGQVGSHGSGDSHEWAVVPHGENRRKRVFSANEETTLEGDSTLVNGPTSEVFAGPGNLDENFESCVKAIRRLECQGYIEAEFRLKLLTWFSLRSTEQERRVVNTFIRTLSDDPKSLAGQLVDSFTDMISSKRKRNGFCNKLWH